MSGSLRGMAYFKWHENILYSFYWILSATLFFIIAGKDHNTCLKGSFFQNNSVIFYHLVFYRNILLSCIGYTGFCYPVGGLKRVLDALLDEQPLSLLSCIPTMFKSMLSTWDFTPHILISLAVRIKLVYYTKALFFY